MSTYEVTETGDIEKPIVFTIITKNFKHNSNKIKLESIKIDGKEVLVGEKKYFNSIDDVYNFVNKELGVNSNGL